MNDMAGAVKSATRVLDLLEMLAMVPEQVGVSEISRRLGIPKSSTHMLLGTLEARGYVVGTNDRRFHLNPIFNREGRSWVGGSSLMLMRLAKPVMQALAASSGESSFLGIAASDSSVTYITKVVSAHEVRCDGDLGVAWPIHSTSAGLALLAFQPAELTERYLQRGKLERLTAQTIVDARQLRRELAQIRARGYAVVRDTSSPGASGVAVPIFDAGGVVIAALNVSAPTARFEPVLKKVTPALIRAAEGLSRSWE